MLSRNCRLPKITAVAFTSITLINSLVFTESENTYLDVVNVMVCS